MLHSYWQPLEESYSQNANIERAAQANAYMRNQYAYYGIIATQRRALFNEFYKKYPFPEPKNPQEIIRSAWEHPCREMQYAAMEVLFKIKNKTGPEIIDLYKYLILNKSWWDTIDYIAPSLVGHYFDRFPERRLSTIDAWLKSENLWLKRSTLIFQLKYKNKTDETLLFQLSRDLSNEKDFFIRKAIGWSLRTYARINPTSVIDFVEQTPLSGLSKREALKHLK